SCRCYVVLLPSYHGVGLECFISRSGGFAHSWLGDGLLASMKTEVSPFFIARKTTPMPHRLTTSNGPTVLRRKLPLAVILPLTAGLLVTAPPPAAFAATDGSVVHATQITQDVPEADLLDVSFEDGSATDTAQGRSVEVFGEPKIADDPALNRVTADFDGDDAFSYPMTADDYDTMQDGFSVECGFMATAATTDEDTFCGNKEAGGWAMVVKDGRAAFMLHADGGYTFAWADIDLNRWYHAAGVYDGETVKFYLDGELAAEAVAG